MRVCFRLAGFLAELLLFRVTRAASWIVDLTESDCCIASSAIDHHVSLFFREQSIVRGEIVGVHLDRSWGKAGKMVLVLYFLGNKKVGKETIPRYPG